MDDISEFLLGPQRSTGSTFGIVLAVIGVVLAAALMVYLLRCYIVEALLRKRVKRLVRQAHDVPGAAAEAVCSARASSQTGGLRKKLSGMLPSPHRADGTIKVRRRAPHPWKHRFPAEAPTPH